MILGNAINSLHEALASATRVDLPPVEYFQRDYAALNKVAPDTEQRTQLESLNDGKGPGTVKYRRPNEDEVSVVMCAEASERYKERARSSIG